MNYLKKHVKHIVIFLILICFTFYFVFRGQSIKEIFIIISKCNIYFLLIAFIIMFMFYAIQAYNVKSLLKVLGQKVSYLKMLKFTLIEFFFSAITPASTGGQPIEIFYMAKDKIPVSKSTLSLLIQICSYQLGVLLFSIFGAIYKPAFLNGVVKYFYIYGVIINLLVIVTMYVCIFSKKIATKAVNLLIKFGNRFHIKAITNKKDDIFKSLEKYEEGSKFIKKHKFEFVKSIIRGLFQITCHYIVTYFIYRALGFNEIGFIEITAAQAIFYAASGCVPLPGSIGANEMLFLLIHKFTFGPDHVRPAMLLNLGVTFYIFVVISFVIVLINTIKLSNKKEKKHG